MSKLYLGFVVCMLAVLAVKSAPLKDQDIEELLYKLQELRHQNEGKQHNKMAKARLHVRSYAPTPLNKLFTSDLVGVAAKRPNLDELDRIGFNQFSKRNMDELDRINFNTLDKRSFDEIDRLSFNELDDAIFDMDKYPAHNIYNMYGRDGRFTRKV